MKFVNSFMAAELTNIASSLEFIRTGFLCLEFGIELAVNSTLMIKLEHLFDYDIFARPIITTCATLAKARGYINRNWNVRDRL